MDNAVQCQACGGHFLLTDPSHIAQGANCPNCGSQVYRSVPGGIPDDMQLREDLIDPGDDSKMKGNPLDEGTLGGWQNRQKRDESFASVKTAAVIEAVPHSGAGIHFGPSAELARHGVTINGEQFSGRPQEIAMRYSPMNPEWDRAPVILEHENPNVLEGAKAMVESGNPSVMHPYVHNAFKETVQPHPNGLSADVVLGLGAMDTYLNDQRVRGLVQQPTDLPWDGNPVTIGAQSPEELAVAKRVLTEGSSNPAREYQMSQRNAKLAMYRQGKNVTAAFPSGSDQWRMGKNGRGFLFPDGSVTHWHVDPQMGGWPTHIDAAKMMGIAPNAGTHFEIQPDGGVSVYLQGPEREAAMQQILASHPHFKDQAGGWAFSHRSRRQDIYQPWIVTADNAPGYQYAPQISPQQPAFPGDHNHGLQGDNTQLPANTPGYNLGPSGPGTWNGPSLEEALGLGLAPMGLMVAPEALGAGLAGDAADIGASGGGVAGAGDVGGASGGIAGTGADYTGGAAAGEGEGSAAGNALKNVLQNGKAKAFGEGGAVATAATAMKSALSKAPGKILSAGKNYATNELKNQFGIGPYGQGGFAGGLGGSPYGGAPFEMGLNGAPTNETYLPSLSSKVADYESPSSNPDIPGLKDGDFQYQDPHEFAAGDQANNPVNPNQDVGVGSKAYHPAAQAFLDGLPRILHYYMSPESGANDPQIMAIHHALEKAHPGYLSLASPHGLDHRPVHHHAALPQPGVGPTCPHCNGVLDANQHCPQCGYTPAQPQPAVPGNTPGFQPTSALDQGPQTDEQRAAVAELLEQQGRAKEIPLMLQQGYLYAKELAQVQHKLNHPPENVPPEEKIQPPVEQTPPGAGMPMPGMQSPQMPLSSIQKAIKRFAVDNVAPACPRCKSHTTGVLNEEGDCRCHSCGKMWSVKPLTADKIGRVAVDNVAPACPKCKSHTTGVLNEDGDCVCHACGKQWNVKPLTADKIGTWKSADIDQPKQNVVDVPADEQVEQRDIRHEQDTSGYWKDSTGNKLIAGQEYEMHSSKYPIPDIIRVESVKPDEILFTIQSKFGLSPRDKVSRHEAQLEQLSFVPYNQSHEPSNPEDAPSDGNDHYEGPGQVSDLSTPPRSTVTHVEAAGTGIQTGPEPTPWKTTEVPVEETPEQVPEQEPEPEPQEKPQESPKESSTHCSSCGSDDITSEMHSPELTHYDCYRCGHNWDIDTGEENIHVTSGILPESTRAWIREGTSGPIAHIGMERDTSGGSRDIRTLSKRYAGAKFTPAQQKEFINEKGNARNKDRLDLANTHYESRSRYKTRDDGIGNAYEVNEDHLALGL